LSLLLPVTPLLLLLLQLLLRHGQPSRVCAATFATMLGLNSTDGSSIMFMAPSTASLVCGSSSSGSSAVTVGNSTGGSATASH
jgi:hypothetical protein